MYGYKIKQDNGKYYFKLYPGNKPNQYIGESRRYNKKEDCEKALKEFRNFVKDNMICTPKVRHFWRCIFLWQRKGKNIENTRQNSNYLL